MFDSLAVLLEDKTVAKKCIIMLLWILGFHNLFVYLDPIITSYSVLGHVIQSIDKFIIHNNTSHQAFNCIIIQVQYMFNLVFNLGRNE